MHSAKGGKILKNDGLQCKALLNRLLCIVHKAHRLVCMVHALYTVQFTVYNVLDATQCFFGVILM